MIYCRIANSVNTLHRDLMQSWFIINNGDTYTILDRLQAALITNDRLP